MANRTRLIALATLMIGALASVSPSFAQGDGQGKPFQIGVQQNVQAPATTYPAYPVPTMIPQPARVAPIVKPPKKKPLKANLEQQVEQPMQQRQPIRANIQQAAPIQARVEASPPPGVLPTQFMGNWLVLGSRSKIDARPEYQNGIENIFTASNSQTWNIVGGPGGYSMSSTTGVQSVQVGQCQSTTAFLRYQHQVGKTMAQEAIVMQLSPDGQTFQGMQRITIRKPGEASARAMVTYQLMGRRQ